MSVIGKLDEQVEAIIIAPVAGKGEKLNRKEQNQRQDKPSRSHNSEQSGSENESANGRQEGAANNRAQKNELPVWLL
jgi:hypothetical protein